VRRKKKEGGVLSEDQQKIRMDCECGVRKKKVGCFENKRSAQEDGGKHLNKGKPELCQADMVEAGLGGLLQKRKRKKKANRKEVKERSTDNDELKKFTKMGGRS